jgi:1,4-alpha-glucan branching enzyme
VHHGGLGFGFKWNMGWMNDSLRYLGREPIYRQHHHHEMTFAMAYAYSENFILPISHDEVVHGKGSMFERAPQDEWRKFANLRAYYAFMWSHPGKKLLFMGTEFGQRREFSEARSIDWGESSNWGHRGVQRLIKDMNEIYKEHPALWKRDTDPSGFAWIDADDHGGNVFSWLRYDGEGQMLACVTNFSSEPRPDYRIGLPQIGAWQEILNTDAEVYDGTGLIGNLGQVIATEIPAHGYRASAPVTIPPLGAVWLRFETVPDEDQEEPEKVTAGVRAAAKQVSRTRSRTTVEEEEEEARSRRGRTRLGGAPHAEQEESAVKPEALPTEALKEDIGSVDETEAATIQPTPRVAPRTSAPPPAGSGRSANQT